MLDSSLDSDAGLVVNFLAQQLVVNFLTKQDGLRPLVQFLNDSQMGEEEDYRWW